MWQVKLLKKWEQHLDATHAVQGAVDAVGHHCLHILWEIQYSDYNAYYDIYLNTLLSI